ncbi:hypothetical protein E2542_SST09714 [Spatholobus suberectus]|nr:hypothetical protein E2542_SST09714 [Spatholobus suberectus]
MFPYQPSLPSQFPKVVSELSQGESDDSTAEDDGEEMAAMAEDPIFMEAEKLAKEEMKEIHNLNKLNLAFGTITEDGGKTFVAVEGAVKSMVAEEEGKLKAGPVKYKRKERRQKYLYMKRVRI